MSNVVAQSRVGDPAASEADWEDVDILKQRRLAHSVLVGLMLHQDREALEADSEVDLAAGEEEEAITEDTAVTVDLVGQEQVSDIKAAAMDSAVKLPLMPLLVLEVDEVAGSIATEKRQAAIGNR